jgi:hypothetical protein
MAAGAELSLLVCRAMLRATRPLVCETPAANLFRGALGMVLPGELFRPTAGDGPSGFRDRPRPFVLRCSHLDGQRFPEGQAFEMGLHLFCSDASPFEQALARLPFARLESLECQPLVLPLSARAEPVDRVRVEFLTPTELKPPVARGQLPPFALLAARLRDRISALAAFHGPAPLDIDYPAFAAGARDIATLGGELRGVALERTSRRTGETHPLGGFTGYTDYAGPLAAYVPWLEAGYYTGAGRQTVWGKGVIRATVL